MSDGVDDGPSAREHVAGARAARSRLRRRAREANPLDERTSITVPLFTVDYRLTPRLGVQASAGVPVIARTGVVQGASARRSFETR